MKAKVYATLKNGSDIEITGTDQFALDRIEEILKCAGFRWNEQVETWDEGFYVSGDNF